MSNVSLLHQQRRAAVRKLTTQPVQRIDNFTGAYLQSVRQWEETAASTLKEEGSRKTERTNGGGCVGVTQRMFDHHSDDVPPQTSPLIDDGVVVDNSAHSIAERARLIRHCRLHFQEVTSLAPQHSVALSQHRHSIEAEVPHHDDDEPQNSSGDADDEGPQVADSVAPQQLISGPSVQRPTDGWSKRMLLDDEEDGGVETLIDRDDDGQGVPGTAASEGTPLADVNVLLASTANEVRDDDRLVAYLHDALNTLWVEEHPQPDFDTEAQRAKTIPKLIEGSMKYVAQLMALAEQQQQASVSLPLVSKYPPPQFYDSSLSRETNRLMRWLQTWRRDHVGNTTTEGSGSAEADSEDDELSKAKKSEEAQRQQLLHGDSTFLFDSRGRRLSARIARIEALQKAKEEEEERERQQQRGYFSNDTSGLGSVSTAGGAGARSNIAVLSGPCGIGKTAAAYLAAGTMNYRVVEINTSTRRTAKGIEQFVSEATQSRQIQQGTSKSVGRDELQRWKYEAEIRDREAQRRQEAERLRVETEAAAKRAKEEAAAAQEAATARLQAKRAAGVKKGNAISKSAIATFFQPKKKQPPPSDAEIVNVDDVQGKQDSTGDPRVVISVDEDSQQGGDSAVSTSGGGNESKRRTDNGNCGGGPRNNKRPRSDGDGVVSLPTADGSKKAPLSRHPAEPIVIPHDACEEVAGLGGSTLAAVPAAPPAKRERLPLILIESADVILDDELMRPFYAAIRAMAAESKFPIIVTANGMASQQASSYFGHGTPHAAVQPPTALYVVLQLFLLTLVERGLITLTTVAHRKRPRVRLAARDQAGDSVLQQALDEAFDLSRRIVVEVAAQRPNTAAYCGGVGVRGRHNQDVDVRRCINALQFELLQRTCTTVGDPRISSTAVSPSRGGEATGAESPTSPQVIASPSSMVRAVRHDVPLLAVADCLQGAAERAVFAAQLSSAPQLAVDADSDDDDPTKDHSTNTSVAAHDSNTALHPATSFAAAPAVGNDTTAQPQHISTHHSGKAPDHDAFGHVDGHPPNPSNARIEARQRLIALMHRTRAITAKAYSTSTPTTLMDALSFGTHIVHAAKATHQSHSTAAKSRGTSPKAPQPSSACLS